MTANVIAFPKRKPASPSWPEWKQDLFAQWRDTDKWVLGRGGGRWLNIPRYCASIFPVTVVGDDGLDEAWWSYSVHGAPEPESAWFEPTDAEFAAWEALVAMIERRMKGRKRR